MQKKMSFAVPVFVALILASPSAQEPLEQSQLAAQLASPDQSERSRALQAIGTLSVAEIRPEVRRALIGALERENADVRRRSAALQRGETVEPRENPFYGDVLHAVTKLQDPAAIAAISEALGTGNMATKALVGFGERAAPAVLAVVNAPERPASQVDSGLRVLRLMSEPQSGVKLSPSARRQIAAAAKARLTGRQRPTVLLAAIELAKTLKDPEVTHAVEALLSNSPTLAELATEDAVSAERVRSRASEALARLGPR